MSVDVIGATLSPTGLTGLTVPGANNSKAAWTQLSAAAPIAATGIILVAINGGNSGNMLIDVGIGPSNAEFVIASNLVVYDDNSSANMSHAFYIPVGIPAGTRVAARYQASSSSCSVSVAVYLLNDMSNVPLLNTISTSYGQVTGTSRGTTIDPGTSANTKGSYTELTAATTDAIDHVMILASTFGHTGSGNPVFSTQWLLDVAMGPSGSEVVVIPNVYFQIHQNRNVLSYSIIGPFSVLIPAGSRIAVRAQSNDTDATNRLIDLQVVGLRGIRRRSISSSSWLRWGWK